jgi:glycosyltransferase involved in cell wall biosynthesis
MSNAAVSLGNAAWAGAEPRVSVLIPFYRDDPSRLVHELDRPDLPIELVLLDDGSADGLLAERVARLAQELRTPTRLIRLHQNEGRAKGRNRLARAARGRHLLFLDCDMLPDAPDFLDRWLGLAEREDPPVAFGGFSLAQAPWARVYAVHRAMALRSECLLAEVRRRTPEKYVFTSNLLVRRDVLGAEPFDADFHGWGWEDVEWAMRVSRRHPILHVDNSATHLGLASASALAAKFEQSAENFARVVAEHADIVSHYPSYRVARALKLAPLRAYWRPWLKALALMDAGPASARAFALRLYRAALYAETV